MAKEKKYERFIDRFFDEDNFENVKLEDVDGNEIEFKQIALVDYNEKYYTIFDPVTKLDGIEEGMVFVFMLDEEQDELVLIEDENTIQDIFNVYYEMCEEEEAEEK